VSRLGTKAVQGNAQAQRCGALDRRAGGAAFPAPRRGGRVPSRSCSGGRSGRRRGAAIRERVRHRRCESVRVTPEYPASLAAVYLTREPNRYASAGSPARADFPGARRSHDRRGLALGSGRRRRSRGLRRAASSSRYGKAGENGRGKFELSGFAAAPKRKARLSRQTAQPAQSNQSAREIQAPLISSALLGAERPARLENIEEAKEPHDVEERQVNRVMGLRGAEGSICSVRFETG